MRVCGLFGAKTGKRYVLSRSGAVPGGATGLQGCVALGVGGEAFAAVRKQPPAVRPAVEAPEGHGNENNRWIERGLWPAWRRSYTGRKTAACAGRHSRGCGMP